MKFCVSSKLLYSYVSAVNKVINSKNALAILNNFLISLDGETLTITGSDVENALTARIPVEQAEGSGSICIDAARFVNLLKEIPDQGLTFEVDEDNKVHIDYTNGSCEFVGNDGLEYPTYQIEDSEDISTFTCPASVIVKGIENTLFAASTDDYRPMMMGVFFDIQPDSITFVATDTRKLVKYTNSTIKPGISAGRIVPSKAASILRNVFAKGEDIEITLTPKCATIKNEDFVFNCRFLQGNFPDYNRVIPRNNMFVLSIDRLSLLNAVRRVGLFINQEYGLEKFRITPDSIELKSDDNNMMTSANEKLPCSFTGDNLVIGFSAPYLTEILNTIKTDDLTISLSDPSRPGLFRPSEDEDGSELVMLLMPMTVGEY